MERFIQGAVGSKWQNPYHVVRFGIDQSLILYEERVRNTPELMNKICKLKGMEMGCCYKPKNCHGDILIKLYKEYEAKQIERMWCQEELTIDEIESLVPL